jgi:ubiquinone/menaquinone biosynthesis C-methylase UbiE
MKNRANPFNDPIVAQSYEGWFETPAGSVIDQEEAKLITSMVPAGDGNKLLDVGCGTGHFARLMAKLGYDVYGLDVSAAMLVEAKKRGGGRYFLGDAGELPHRDASFYAASAFTLLEFVDDPEGVISEMIRVSKKIVVVAFLNRWGAINIRRKVRNLLGRRDVYSDARFFGVSEMKRIVRQAPGMNHKRVEIQWGSAVGPRIISKVFSRSRLGSFILFVVRLV